MPHINEGSLNSLAILNIGANLTVSTNYDNVIEKFVNQFVHYKKN